MNNIDGIMIWLYYIWYKFEDILTDIFSDDGRRHNDDIPKL